MGQMRVRPYYGGDMDLIKIIDIQGFEEPWTDNDIRNRGHNIVVAEIDDRIQLFACVEAVASSARLMRFAVSTQYRRKGYGSRLMNFLLAEYGNMKKMTTVIPESNLPAQLFLRKHGWRYVNTLRDHFTNCGRLENGYYFLRML